MTAAAASPATAADGTMRGKAPRAVWSDADIEALRRLAAGGASVREAAAALGRTFGGTVNAARRYGIGWCAAAAAARRSSAMKANHARKKAAGRPWMDDAARERQMAGVRAALARRQADPEWAAANRARLDAFRACPAITARRSAAARARQLSRLAWCPAPLLPDYRALLRAGYRAAEAREMMAVHVARWHAEQQRIADSAAPTVGSLQWQLARLAAGARLVETVRPPRAADYHLSLTGCSAGLAAAAA